MDLSVLDTRKKANEGSFLHLKHPGTGAKLYDNDDKEKPVGLILHGKDSNVYAEYKHKKMNARISSKGDDAVTSEAIEESTREMAAALTSRWVNMSLHGNSDCTNESSVALYSEFPWVYEQADEYIHNRANFI